MSDPAFAEELFNNPQSASAGYELTAEKAGKFRALSWVKFDRWADPSPDDRKSFLETGASRLDGGKLDQVCKWAMGEQVNKPAPNSSL